MMATVGPTMNTISIRANASIRFMLDSHLMPLLTPVRAEVRNNTVVTAMMASCEAMPTFRPNTACRPLLICKAPMPSEAATPKAVATTASTFTIMVSFGAQVKGSASVAELIKAGLPRRNEKKAMDSATTL